MASPSDQTPLRRPRAATETPRVGPFAVDHGFEEILTRANAAWAGLEDALVGIATADPPRRPFLVLCYPPRSGSSFFGQLLARTRRLGYVSNFVARFWEAPYLAALLEQRLGLQDLPFPERLASEYGVTGAPNEPHEFGFFWNRWLVFSGETHRVDAARMTPERRAGLRRELLALGSLEDRPFFLKSDLVGLNAAFFYGLLPDVRFVVLRRDPRFVAQSIYEARLTLYGDPGVYWSTRPSCYPSLWRLAPEAQIARQIEGVYADVYADLAATGAAYVEVDYEALCANPAAEVRRVLAFAGVDDLEGAVDGLTPRGGGNRRYLPDDLFEGLARAVARTTPPTAYRSAS